MTFNIRGEYCFNIQLTTMFLNTTLKINHTNMITRFGESFFLNRCINDSFNPIQHICIGNGVNPPQKMDSKLSNETKRNTCIQKVDMDNKRLILTTTFETSDVIGASEIGVVTTNTSGEEILISHDVFNDTILQESFLYGVTGSITLEYSFYFSTSQLKTGWSKYGNDKNVYWVFESNPVLRVYDNTSNYGLRQVDSIIEVQDNVNTYYHDINNTHNLYIHLYHRNEPDKIVYAPNPNTHDILVENR